MSNENIFETVATSSSSDSKTIGFELRSENAVMGYINLFPTSSLYLLVESTGMDPLKVLVALVAKGVPFEAVLKAEGSSSKAKEQASAWEALLSQ